MELHVLNTGKFKLDGGAMFGVVPKVLWQKSIEPDENNLCTWAMRCLLIEDGNRLILIDTGLGDKQEEKFFKHYYRSETQTLAKGLNQLGFSIEDVTDVFLTHLHFDHCGGAVNRNSSGKFETALPNATYWSNASHWKWATEPNKRERASFLSENILPIHESGQLKMVETGVRTDDLPFDVLFFDGHTEKQMIPIIEYKGRKVAYVADLLPSHAHLPIPYVMGYDTRPLLTMTEKEEFLNMAERNNFALFFEHDSQFECADLQRTERGIILNKTFKLSEL